MKELKRFKVVARGEDLTIVPQQGIYNQPLFDLCADDSLVSFTLMESYNPALDAIGFVTTNLYRQEQNMITYVGPAGTAADSPVASDHSDPCAPGTSVEFGHVSYILEGFGRLRKTSDSRDITDVVTKYCLKTPTYNIGGMQIMDDYEWDVVQQMTVILQDFQRRVINGNAATPGQADGLDQIITFGYTDPITGEAATSMDSIVVDYNNNLMCPPSVDGDNGVDGVEVNGVAVTDGVYDLYAFIASFLRRVRVRINNSPNLTGQPKHIGLLSNEHLNSLIECWVCNTHCGGEKSQMFESEVQVILNGLKSELFRNNSVTLEFHGIPVTFFAYDYGTLVSTEIEEDGGLYGNIYILTTDVGNQPLMRIQVKDMSAVTGHEAASSAQFTVTDNNRVLSWKYFDNTCYRVSSEMQWRIWSPAPWAQMRIENVSAVPVLGTAIMSDPLSDLYLETNKVASTKATSSTFTSYEAPVAIDKFYTRTASATNLVVAAGSGLLTGVGINLGYPTATATAVAGAATTAGGTITITADGAFNYSEPSGTFEGVDTYVFTISNAQGSDTATLTIVSYTDTA